VLEFARGTLSGRLSIQNHARCGEGFLETSARTRWSIIAGVNLAQNSASWVLAYGRDMAQTAAGVSGSRLIRFELGNEPDLYSGEWLFDSRRSIRWSDRPATMLRTCGATGISSRLRVAWGHSISAS